MKDAYYFSHDSNARNDEKILELRAVYGWEGYGIFWAVIEKLRDATMFRLSMSRLAGLALELQVDKTRLEAILNLCFELKLLETDKKSFWSASLEKRMMRMQEITEKRKQAAERKWAKEKEKSKKSEPEIQAECKSNASAEQLQYKGKEMKGNETKGNKNSLSGEFQKIQNSWNVFALKHKLPVAMGLDEGRKEYLAERLSEKEFDFPIILKEIENSDFLLGKVTDFAVSLDYIISKKLNYIKILEGSHRNRNNGKEKAGIQNSGGFFNSGSKTKGNKPGQSTQSRSANYTV